MQAAGAVVRTLGLAVAATVVLTLGGCAPVGRGTAARIAHVGPGRLARTAHVSPGTERRARPALQLAGRLPDQPAGGLAAVPHPAAEGHIGRVLLDHPGRWIEPAVRGQPERGRRSGRAIGEGPGGRHQAGVRVPDAELPGVTDQPIRLPDGPSAHLLSSTFDDPTGTPRQNLQLVAARAGKVYAVTFTATAATFVGLHALFERSLSSFALS